MRDELLRLIDLAEHVFPDDYKGRKALSEMCDGLRALAAQCGEPEVLWDVLDADGRLIAGRVNRDYANDVVRQLQQADGAVRHLQNCRVRESSFCPAAPEVPRG